MRLVGWFKASNHVQFSDHLPQKDTEKELKELKRKERRQSREIERTEEREKKMDDLAEST